MSNPFEKRTLFIIIGVAVVSLVTIVVLTVLGDRISDKQSAGADAYSYSAIGHHGLAKLLEKLDVPVIVSRSGSGDRAKNGLLILAEPTVTDDDSRDRVKALVRSAPRTLVVLPKWYGSTERGKKWIEDAFFVPPDEVIPVLRALDLDDADLSRFDRSRMQGWRAEPGTALPVIREPQLVLTERLTPMIDDASGAQLVGCTQVAESRDEWDDNPEGDRLSPVPPGPARKICVLADPDVLNNHGLRHAENARFTANLIDELREGGPVVIDETMHGYARQPSLLRTLFSFPLVIATMQVLICALLVVWAAMVRFGPRKTSLPPIAPGKDFLIRNTAALLHYGGHHAYALRRYLSQTTAIVRHALHAPSLGPTAMTAWFERVRQTRGGKISLVELEKWVETADTPERVVEVTDLIYRWRLEMTHGADSRS